VLKKTCHKSSCEISLNKTESGTIFWIAEMTTIAFNNESSVWFTADIFSVEVELSDEKNADPISAT